MSSRTRQQDPAIYSTGWSRHSRDSGFRKSPRQLVFSLLFENQILTSLSERVHLLQLQPRRVRPLHKNASEMDQGPKPKYILAHADRIRTHARTQTRHPRTLTKWCPLNLSNLLHQIQNIPNNATKSASHRIIRLLDTRNSRLRLFLQHHFEQDGLAWWRWI